MKTVVYIKIALFSFFLLIFESNYLVASNNIFSGDSLICLEITGKIKLQNNKGDKKVKIELIRFNTVIDSVLIKHDKKFRFYFAKNTYYTLRISKPGYITKIITVCTILKKFEPNESYYKFYFDTELLPALATEILDPEVLEFPIAIIAFDEKLKAFYINEKYTSNIKKESFYK